MRVARINSGKTGYAVSWTVTNTTGMMPLAVIWRQGILPFEDRAGAAELQTSRLLSMSHDSPAPLSENDDSGVTRVIESTIRRVMDILLIGAR